MMELQPAFQLNGDISLLDFKIVVLLVDDQQLIAEAVRRLLAGHDDIEFYYCSDPAMAIKEVLRIRPTVILQDLVMPDIDGLTLLKYYRAHPDIRNIPVIVLSVKEEPKVKSEAFYLGANDYLVKLPDEVELVARLRYHSKAYVYQLQRDEAFKALQESQQRLAEMNKRLMRLSILDGLTGIPNRRRFDESLGIEWKRAMRNKTPISLILMDIDYFKLYNDHYGHQEGDECLKKVAKTLESLIQRPTDLVSRYGGEEFVALLPETGPDGAKILAERMRQTVEELCIPHQQSKVSKCVTLSLGVASVVPERGESAEKLVEMADKALYKAKQSGRNRVELFQPSYT